MSLFYWVAFLAFLGLAAADPFPPYITPYAYGGYHTAFDAPSGHYSYHSRIVGDINADGYDDFAITDESVTDDHMYLIWGSPSLPSNINYTTISIPAEGLYINIRHTINNINRLGDFNGDGYDDFVLGCDESAYLFFGSPTFDVTDTNSLTSSKGIYFDDGSTNIYAYGAGDINDDGKSDIILHYEDNLPATWLLIYGSDTLGTPTDISDPTASSAWSVITKTSGVKPTSAAGVGDVDGDGVDDLALGITSWNSNAGAVWVLLGAYDFPQTIDCSEGTEIYGYPADYKFGTYISGLGDVDNDGLDDFAVVTSCPTCSDVGEITIVYGSGPAFSGNPSLDIYSSTDRFSILSEKFTNKGVTSLDANGDSYMDILMGAIYDQTDVGKAYLFFGNGTRLTGSYPLDSLPANRVSTFGAEDANLQYFAYDIGVGDVNGDSVDDIIFATLFPHLYYFQSFPSPTPSITPTTSPTTSTTSSPSSLVTPSPTSTPTPSPSPSAPSTPNPQVPSASSTPSELERAVPKKSVQYIVKLMLLLKPFADISPHPQ